MTALLWVPVAYLALGCVCAGLINWHVERGAPAFAILWVFGCAVVMVPYVCVRHLTVPWQLDMVIRKGML